MWGTQIAKYVLVHATSTSGGGENRVVFQRLHLRSLDEQSLIFFLVNTTWKNSEMLTLCIVVRFFYVKWWFLSELGLFLGKFLI